MSDQKMTAAEADRLVEDSAENLGPVLERFQNSLLEPVLQAAAKWATEMSDGDECPADLYAECPDEGRIPCPSACSRNEKMQCWIEFWRKEAEG